MKTEELKSNQQIDCTVNGHNVVKFIREGIKEKKAYRNKKYMLKVNGNEITTWIPADDVEVKIPVSGKTLDIEIIQKLKNGKGIKCIGHTFEIIPGNDYECSLVGKYSNFTGLGLKMSAPGQHVDDSTPAVRSCIPIALLGFAFPIYGFYKAIFSRYNRKAGLVGALIGFGFAMIFSLMAGDADSFGLGIGSKPFIEYKPFSVLDILFNLLIGGIASLRGVPYLLK